MRFGTICSFRRPLGVLECIPRQYRETTVHIDVQGQEMILLNPFMYLRSVYLFEDYWIIMSSAANRPSKE